MPHLGSNTLQKPHNPYLRRRATDPMFMDVRDGEGVFDAARRHRAETGYTGRAVFVR